MAPKEKTVLGDVQDATEEGFARLLVRANDAAERGMTMIGVVAIGSKKIGAVFVRLPKRSNGADAPLIGE